MLRPLCARRQRKTGSVPALMWPGAWLTPASPPGRGSVARRGNLRMGRLPITPSSDRSLPMPTTPSARSADLAVLARDVADRACELAAFLDTDPELSGEVLRQLGHTLNGC